MAFSNNSVLCVIGVACGQIRKTTAHFPLDFVADRTCVVAKGRAAMDAKTLGITLRMHLSEMGDWLDRATSIGAAANTCAEAGNVQKTIEIALDIEHLVYEVNTLLN